MVELQVTLIKLVYITKMQEVGATDSKLPLQVECILKTLVILGIPMVEYLILLIKRKVVLRLTTMEVLP
jgi:hypothetical protein